MKTLEISNLTIIRIILFVLGIWFLYYILDVLVLLFIVFILVAALSPTVDRWAEYITRPGAVVSIFFLIITFFSLVSTVLIPPLVTQLREFALNINFITYSITPADQPEILQNFLAVIKENLTTFSGYLSNLGSLVITRTLGVVSGLVAILTIAILTFYLLLEEEGVKKMFKGILPKHIYDDLVEVTRKIAAKLGAWLRSQLLLMFLVGIGTTIGLLIIGSPYALTLGLWSALTEIIPIIGPWIGAIPGVVVNLAESPLQGFLALVVYLVVQQIENAFLVPKLMSRAVGLNPVVVIVAILIGGKLYGILGVLLSVPAVAVLSVIIDDWNLIKQSFHPES